MKNNLKNVCIVLLAFLAIYQTNQLWFGGNSNHNFFYMLSDHPKKSNFDHEQKLLFASPYRIITCLGNQNFKLDYSGISTNPAKIKIDEILISMFKNGDYVAQSTINWGEIYKSKSIMYDYPFPISTDTFTEALSQNSSILTSKLASFKSILVVPGRSDQVKILFINEDTAYEYKVTVKIPVNAALNLYLEAKINEPTNLSYFSSKQNGIKLFSDNVFIPVLPERGYPYYPIYTENPYEGNAGVLLSSIEKQINMFFKNPSAKISDRTKDGYYSFNEGNVVVKYLTNDVLEYSNFNSDYQKYDSDLLDNFCTAMEFLQKDTKITNEYYLAEIVKDNKDITEEDDKITFYFNYTINNIPIRLSSQFSEDIRLKYPLEVTVVNSQVTKYKKLCTTFHTTTASETAVLSFSEFLNDIYEPKYSSDDFYNNIEICYKLEKSQTLSLNWLIQMDDYKLNYFKSTKSR